MSALVSYEFAEGIARLNLDNGKANALSPEVFAAFNAALDQAEADRAVVVLERGRDAHVVELLDGAGREPVAAGLVAGEGLALEHADVAPGLGQPEAGRRAGRTASDDEDVVPVSCHEDRA